MLSKEEILDMWAKDKMVDWNIRSFKQKFPSLFAVINQSMEQYATQKRVELIEGLKAIQAACDGKDLIWGMAEKIIKDAKETDSTAWAVWKQKAEGLKTEMERIKKLEWSTDGRKFDGNHKEMIKLIMEIATKAIEQFK